MIFDWFRKRRDPTPAGPSAPSREALAEAAELARLRPRVESLVRERDRLLEENNYTARIRALYMGGQT